MDIDRSQKPVLVVIIPCYNEEAVLPETVSQICEKISKLIKKDFVSEKSHVLFVDDGSHDSTWQIIETAVTNKKICQGIKLSRNYGHQNALLAGLFNAKGDIFISIDADLQDDICIFDKMIEKYFKGAQIVYAVRSERKTDSFFKRQTAELFYRFLAAMRVDVIFNHADYRLMSSRVVNELKAFGEVNLFLRGMIPLLGFHCEIVKYKRKKRYAGESKYPLHKMLGLAWDGITSFSSVPLRMISWMGFSVFFISFILSLWVLFVKYITESAVPGWASNVLPIFFLGGVQILSIGVIGEYLGKLYLEVKNRPRFIIETNTYVRQE